jgi:hypothetical protein
MSEGQRWEVILAGQAERALRRLPRPLLQHLDHAPATLAENPTPPECKDNSDAASRVRKDFIAESTEFAEFFTFSLRSQRALR